MTSLLRVTSYLVMVPIIGLLLAAASFFLFGGLNLILTLISTIFEGVSGFGPGGTPGHAVPFLIEIVEYVHQFLVGTVLLITALGFYQLFIHDLDLPGWLDVEGTEELETALIGVTVVVLAVHFMTTVFAGSDVDLFAQGVGTGAVILALAAFLSLRSWGDKQKRLAERIHHEHEPENTEHTS